MGAGLVLTMLMTSSLLNWEALCFVDERQNGPLLLKNICGDHLESSNMRLGSVGVKDRGQFEGRKLDGALTRVIWRLFTILKPVDDIMSSVWL